MSKHSEAKLAVAVAEILDSLYFAEHSRIKEISATYKTLMLDVHEELVPDIKILLEPKEENDD